MTELLNQAIAQLKTLPADEQDAISIWDGQFRSLSVNAAETDPLERMSLLYGHDLRIQAVEGGTVTIEALPNAN